MCFFKSLLKATNLPAANITPDSSRKLQYHSLCKGHVLHTSFKLSPVASGMMLSSAVTTPTIVLGWTHMKHFIYGDKKAQDCMGALYFAVMAHVQWHCPSNTSLSQWLSGSVPVAQLLLNLWHGNTASREAHTFLFFSFFFLTFFHCLIYDRVCIYVCIHNHIIYK